MGNEQTLRERVSILEDARGRIQSDIESEKATRNRVNVEIIKKIDGLSKTVYIGTGILIALQAVFGFYLVLLK